MGHKTIQMTVRYAHLAPQHKLAAVERLCEPVKAVATEEEEGAQEAPTDTRTSTKASEQVLEQPPVVPQAVATQALPSQTGL